MRLFVFILILLGLFSSCKKEYANGFIKYTIKKGHHRSTSEMDFLRTGNLVFKCKFDESAVYTSIDPVNQYDINKLYGFSECSDHHQKNSARFGWRWLNGKLEILAYVYNDGNFSSQKIGDVEIGEVYDYSIIILEEQYAFRLNNTQIYMPRTNDCNVGLYYKLYPYFGGDEKAPHDIRIYIKEDYLR